MALPPTRRQVRIALGMLWLVDAGLQAQPPLFTGGWWRAGPGAAAAGEPPFVSHSVLWAVGVIAAHATVWNAAFVAVQLALGAALVAGRGERLALAASVPWALGVWWVGESLGMLPAGMANLAAGSPGAVLLYPVIGLLAWPRHDGRRRAVSQPWALTAWVLLWAGQTLLLTQAGPPPGRALGANVAANASGEPGTLAVLAHHVEAFVGAHPAAVATTLAVVQLAVGLSVLAPEVARSWSPAVPLGPATRVRVGALAAGAALSLAFWVAVQYFGTVAAGRATDPNSGPLMILLAAALWPPPRPSPAPASGSAPAGYRRTRSAAGDTASSSPDELRTGTSPIPTSTVTVDPSG
jgi:hypothetical protein